MHGEELRHRHAAISEKGTFGKIKGYLRDSCSD